MKTFISKIFNLLASIGKDKYQHDAIGSRIAAWSFIVIMLIGFIGYSRTIFWIAFASSMVSTIFCALWKDCVYDEYADWRDIAATIIGGIRIWVTIIVIYLIL